MFRLGYNTNGLAHHRTLDALRLIAELGYEAVALTPDAGQLDPYHLSPSQVGEVRRAAADMGLALSIETGARYLLDWRRKHWPTLLEPSQLDRGRRADFLRRSIDLAASLGADVLSFWSGAAPQREVGDAQHTAAGAHEELWDRLCAGVEGLLAHARVAGVELAFEPEPGMFLERPAGYDELCRRLGSAGESLRLCLDVGHCVCTGDLPVPDVIARYAKRLGQVHLDDGNFGAHEHLMFGRGELDLRGTLHALLHAHYAGIAAVELSRDSHRGPEAAREALAALRTALRGK